MPQNLAIISNSAFSVVNFRKRLIKDIIAKGWKVTILAPDFNSYFRGILKKIGAVPVDIQMARTGLNPMGDIYSFVKLVRILKSIAPDITFSYGIKPVIHGLTASRMAGIPKRFGMVAGLGTLYVNSDKNPTVKSRFLKSTANLLYKISIKSANKVFFHNPDDIRLFEHKKIIEKGKSVLLNGSGVDIEYYQSDHFQTDPVTFTLVSRLIKEKGIHEFVECARFLKEKYRDRTLRFILLGDTDLNPNSVESDQLYKWVEDKIIEWPGHVEEVKHWLEETSVFVLPTYYREGTPKSILEAMAMGRPVVTTDSPGCREAVKDGINGLYVPPRDSESIAAACEKFIRNPDLIEKMGRESRKIATEKYDIRDVNEQMLSVMGIT